MVAPQTAGHPGTSQQAFKESASGSSVRRAATLGTVVIIIDLVVGFGDADGGCGSQSLTADGCLGRLGSYFGPRRFQFCRCPSRSFSDLPIVMFLELLVRHVIRVRPVPVRPFKQAPLFAERTTTQVVSHLPERVINEPVADRFSFCSSTPGARTRHSHTSARHDVTPGSNCGNHGVPHVHAPSNCVSWSQSLGTTNTNYKYRC